MEKTTPKIGELRVFRQEPNKIWIESLENALERAKSGESSGGAIIESSGDAIRECSNGLKNRYEFIGLLQLTINKLLQ